MFQKVIVLASPVSDRMVSLGALADLDVDKSSIRVGAKWFDYDARWKVVPEEEVKTKNWYIVSFVCDNGHHSTTTSIPAVALTDPIGYLKEEGHESVRNFKFKI